MPPATAAQIYVFKGSAQIPSAQLMHRSRWQLLAFAVLYIARWTPSAPPKDPRKAVSQTLIETGEWQIVTQTA